MFISKVLLAIFIFMFRELLKFLVNDIHNIDIKENGFQMEAFDFSIL